MKEKENKFYNEFSTNNPRIQDQVKSFRALGLVPFYKLLCCIMVLLAIAGCSSKQVSRIQPLHYVAPTLTEEERARFYDIAFPPDARPERIISKKDQIFTFLSGRSIEQLYDFYRADMEYLGWNLVSTYKSQESCLIFEKPTKQCVAMLRPEKGSSRVVLFLGARKTNQNE